MNVAIYRTSDMALTTFLKLASHSPQHIIWEHGTCYWHFTVTEDLLAKVGEFQNGSALVDPREYNRVFNRTKREFYDSKTELESTQS